MYKGALSAGVYEEEVISFLLSVTPNIPDSRELIFFSITLSKNLANFTESVVPAAKLRVFLQLSQISSAPHCSAVKKCESCF